MPPRAIRRVLAPLAVVVELIALLVFAVAGTIGITARSLVFIPIGIFLIVAAVQFEPNHSYGTDAELLRLSGHPWGVAVLAAVSAGLAVFVVFSCIETRYRKVVFAR
jgi:hypothetical protein